MKRKCLAVGIILLFIEICIMPAIAQDTEKPSPVSIGNWLYVGGTGPGNYTTIQDAIDNASDGDTVFVYDDSSPYNERIKINKSINLFGEDRNTTIVRCDYSISVRVDNAIISGFYFIGPDGISISSKNNTIISNNNFFQNFVGINLWNACNNSIFDNYFYDMGSTAIMLSSDSNNNAISNNTIEYAIFGVLIEGACSHNVIIYNNLKSWLAYGVCVRNYIFSSPDDNDIIENKIEGAFYGICLVHSSHDTISNNNIVNNVNGIYLENSGREIISGNYFADNFQGISLINHSCFNKIIYNTFKDVTQNASFSNCFYNKWSRNFWGEPKSAPFTISGYLWNGKLLHIPWFNFDWHPAQEPYDI